MKKHLLYLCLLPALTLSAVWPQQAPQAPSPMVDNTRPHPRISQTEEPGRRIDLKSLKGARLFAGPKVNVNKPVPLVVHFHGVAWLIESRVVKHAANVALITVNLDSGSCA